MRTSIGRKLVGGPGQHARAVPQVFLPRTGPFKLIDYEKVHAADSAHDIFDERGIDRTSGYVVVVRPDQHVAHVLPLTATAEIAAFFAGNLLAFQRARTKFVRLDPPGLIHDGVRSSPG